MEKIQESNKEKPVCQLVYVDTVSATSPLRSALQHAIEEAARLDALYDDCEHEPEIECEHYVASDAADRAVSTVRTALAASTDPRTWRLCEEGTWYSTVDAGSLREALKAACDGVDRDNYPDATGTIWIDVRVRCEETAEEDSATVMLDEDEPDCEAGEEHDWQSPHEIVGGCEENPGVHGHGGGVVIDEVCMQCGCGRQTDTWAQRPDTGEQGYTTVSYERGQYSDEIAALDDAEVRS